MNSTVETAQAGAYPAERVRAHRQDRERRTTSADAVAIARYSLPRPHARSAVGAPVAVRTD